MVCAGFTQGLELLCEVLRARGVRLLAVEAYGHAGHRQIAAGAGMGLVPLAVDDRGADVAALGLPDHGTGQGHPAARAGAVLLSPAHQYPLGVALAPERRRQVADWAARTGGVVIEDDYDGEFRYDRQAVGALQSIASEHVVYAGTASKSLVPGLRLGWLVLPSGLAEDVVARKQAAVRLSSSLDQLALAEFIKSGGYDRQVRRARLAYRQRRDRLVSALARDVPDVQVTGIAAGLHVLVRLPAGLTEEDVIGRAAARGLALQRARRQPGWRAGTRTGTRRRLRDPAGACVQRGGREAVRRPARGRVGALTYDCAHSRRSGGPAVTSKPTTMAATSRTAAAQPARA